MYSIQYWIYSIEQKSELVLNSLLLLDSFLEINYFSRILSRSIHSREAKGMICQSVMQYCSPVAPLAKSSNV